jgi:NAD(P)H-flavin reductase
VQPDDAVPPPPGPLVPHPCRVRHTQRESRDTFTLEVEAPPGAAFAPGQFAMLYVFGVGEAPVSMSGDPSRAGVLVHTTREVGAVTRAMGRLRRGQALGVRGPYGRPWPLAQAAGKDVVLMAGGIGLAPLRGVLYAIAARRRDFGAVSLLYGTRSPEGILFRRELEQWQEAAGIDVSISVDHATRTWPGDVGVVTGLVPGVRFEPRNAVAFICGPEVMMRFAADALRRRGLGAEDVFVSLERNMKCAVGLCGRCQFGPTFVCKDGPVFPWARVEPLLRVREI